MKKLSQAIALAGVMAAGVAAPQFAQAEVEVSASAAVANMYLWRGQDLGNGAAAVSGDLSASTAGAYAGVWTSSGDTAAGQEYDIYAGYGGESDGFSYDVSVWTYVYSGGAGSDSTLGDLTDLIISLGFGGASFSFYQPLAGDDNYNYITLGYGVDKVSATLGRADDGDGADYAHLDLSYAYNDQIAFTLSKVVDQSIDKGNAGHVDEDLKVVMSYSLPIDM